MTISRNLSILAEGVSASGVLAVTNGGTGVTTSTGTGSTVLSASPTLTGTLTVPTVTSAAATALTIQSAGTTAMTVDTSQNVGIGTGSGETIGATLEVRGAVGTALRIRSMLNSVEPTGYYSIGRDTTDGLLKFNGAQTTFVGYKFFNTSSEVMRIDSSGNVGIGTASPNASAILDAQSTTKGVRFPNMTTTQKNAVSSPAAGLVVFDTTLSKLCVYSGSAWQTITSV